MLLYFGGHTISANRMAPKNLNGTIGLHQDNESIEVNLEMFFLFVSVKSELWKFTHVHGYCCRETWEKLASPQTSFGVRLSRIHFSPTDRGGEMNASAGRLGKNSIYQDRKFLRATAPKLSTNDDNLRSGPIWAVLIHSLFSFRHARGNVIYKAKRK